MRKYQDYLDDVYSDVLSTIQKLASTYREIEDSENEKKVLDELEVLERDYSKTHEHVFQKIQGVSTTTSSGDKKLGKDMCQQLKRVQIPVFSGDKRKYETWKAAFFACIDRASSTPEYKLLQLRQYLSGEALKCVDNLGHSAASYQAAKERLERKYGGKRRQVIAFLDEIDKFPIMKDENAKNIEKFADLLDIVVINLREAEKEDDLKDGALYISLQKKMPESM